MTRVETSVPHGAAIRHESDVLSQNIVLAALT